MSNMDGGPLHLHRINLSLNMRRFCMPSIQPTLFGGASLVRHWDRIGARGRAMIETFENHDQADDALRRLQHRKRGRDYSDG